MSLTRGSIAPLARPSGGELNFQLPDDPRHFLFLHGLPTRLRGEIGGVTVVDTRQASMLHETALLPRWYFPPEGVKREFLEPSDTTSTCPFKGEARYWNIRVGDQVIEDAFWEYPETIPGCPGLAGLLAPYAEKFDRWLEEDEEVLGHPRDPFHRVDTRRSSARVVVRAGGEVVADTRSAVALNETGFPLRWYLPMADVRADLLVPSERKTICPYKGVASYHSLRLGQRDWEDAVWSYPDPLPEASGVAGLVSFMGEDVGVEVLDD